MSEDLRTRQWTVITQYNGRIVETQTVWSDSAEQASAYALGHNQSKLETSAIPGPNVRPKRDRQAEWEAITGKRQTEEQIMVELSQGAIPDHWDGPDVASTQPVPLNAETQTCVDGIAAKMKLARENRESIKLPKDDPCHEAIKWSQGLSGTFCRQCGWLH